MFALRRAVQRPVATTLQSVRYSHQSPHGHSGDPKVTFILIKRCHFVRMIENSMLTLTVPCLQEIEQEKQKNLKGHSDSPVEGAPGWNEKVSLTKPD